MPAGQGKISDAGYDQMACLAALIPAHEHVIFRGEIRVLRYPSPAERNGQEGLGLFFRDTLAPDPANGYPYSNMAAAGITRGRPGIFGRDGITAEEIGRVRNFACLREEAFSWPPDGKKLRITLEIWGTRLAAEIAPEGEISGALFETDVGGEIFASRDPGMMALGFFAARGCRMEVDPDSVSVEYEDEADTGRTAPVLYVSPGGSPLGQGTREAPLDFQSAVDRCGRGQQIRVLPGRYRPEGDLVISRGNSGSVRCPKRIVPETGCEGRAVLDFGGKDHGFRIDGDCWDISGLTVTRGLGFRIRGSGNRIRHCRAVANLETGFLIRHPENDSPAEQWPCRNRIEDCVSCLNRDGSEQNADGFACKIAAGPGNVFVRCTAWMNSDDGFDLFSKNRPIGAVRLEECRSWLNGYTVRDGRIAATRGNGNGFKLGGSGLAADHEAVGCEAVGNRGDGFTSNSNPHMRLTGCTAGSNGRNFVYYFTGEQAQTVHVTERCAESDDPAFDPEGWAREHLPLARTEDGLFSGDGAECLADGSGDANGTILRSALKAACARCGAGTADRPAVLIMCYSLYGGGAERVACRLANGLADRFHVILFYIQDKGQTYPVDPRVRTLAMPGFEGSYETMTESRIAFVAALKEALGIRTAVSFMFAMNKLNVKSGGKARVICCERNNPAKRDPGRIGEIAEFYEAADHVVFQSGTVRDLFSQAVREHSSVILNPVSVSCGRVGGRHRIVHMGRLVPQKNQAMLIRAFAAFHRGHPEYTLSIYGEGELAGELQALAASLGLEQAVRFHGQVRDVHAAIADAEMFALSSDYEGLPNALLECMMMGFPCISTRCEGAVDVIRPDENGILADVGSEEQMTAAMTRLAEDAALRERLGAKAKETSALFRADRILAQWERLLQEREEP